MKKIFVCLISLFLVFNLCAQESDGSEQNVSVSKGGISEIPSAKRPKKIEQKNDNNTDSTEDAKKDLENKKNIIQFGKASEVATLLDDLNKNEDYRFSEEIYDLFQETINSTLKEKILIYFTKLEDPCLEDFAVDVMNDPYDEKNSLVKAVFDYISAVKTKCAIPAVISIIEGENESYFNDAINTLAEIGDSSEAMFLAQYLDRDDLSVPQRQSLMRACGKIHAVETWGLLVDIIEDEDENMFVRMYAAEAIGLMKVDKSVKVLTRNFDSTDPNFRQYVIKGLKNFPDNKEACAVILQGIKDDHWRVQQESIKAAKEMNLKSAMPTLIHRAKNDSEKLIKEESFTTIAYLNTEEGNKFLVEQLTDKKIADTTKVKIVQVLMKENNAGKKEIIALAEETLTDDKRKTLRYAIGNEIAKKDDSMYEDLCCKFLQSSDVTTISIGLDMYKKAHYSSAEPIIRRIIDDKKLNANVKKRAAKILGVEYSDANQK